MKRSQMIILEGLANGEDNSDLRPEEREAIAAAIALLAAIHENNRECYNMIDEGA